MTSPLWVRLPITTRSSAERTAGSGLMISALIKLNTAVFAPIPRLSVNAAMPIVNGDFSSTRISKRRSCQNAFTSRVSHVLARRGSDQKESAAPTSGWLCVLHVVGRFTWTERMHFLFSKRTRVFLIIWLGQFLSIIGSGMTSFVLGIWVYQRHSSTGQFSTVVLAASLPGILMGPFAGALVDKWDKRRTMIAAVIG